MTRSCNSPGATHHLACDCREAEFARLTRERDEAMERAASLSRELLAAIQARDSYRMSAELRVGMRREFEELLGVGDTMAPETFEAGLARLRALLAAESRAAREKAERELASVTTDRDSWAEQADQRAIEAVEYLGRAEAAEARAERLEAALREIADECDCDFPRCQSTIARAALGEEGK